MIDKMTTRKKMIKKTAKMVDDVKNRNHINHQGVPIELPTNDRLKELSEKHFNKDKRKRSENYKDALQKDIDGIMKKVV